jgi:peptide deformylase
MAVLEIKRYPEKILKQKAAPVKSIDGKLQALIDDMIETMYAAPGVGLAAPQVGISKRLTVIDVSAKGSKMPLLVLINPVFLKKEGSVEFEEGCLSLPDFTSKVTRAEKVVIRAVNREGKEMDIETGGMLAIALQHEIDHLDGFLLIDRISPIKREFFKKRYRKTHQQGR